MLRSATRDASHALRRSSRLNGATPLVQSDILDLPINAILTTHLHICNRAPLASVFPEPRSFCVIYVST